MSVLALPASAAPFPSSVPLPVDFQPEGIAVGTGSTFYSGSLWDGDIYRGSLRSGDGGVFIDVSGRQALGMKVDEGRHLLFVAGGFTGHGYVYSTRTGATIADLPLGTPGASLVNDVALTRHAAYFTDTFAPVIYKVPISPDGTLGPTESITVTGPAGVSIPGTFGLNGIDAPSDGSVLLVNHTQLGILATVDPDTGESTLVDITGGALVAGTAGRAGPGRPHRVGRAELRQLGRRGPVVPRHVHGPTGPDDLRPGVPSSDDRRNPWVTACPREQPLRPWLPATARSRRTPRNRLQRSPDPNALIPEPDPVLRTHFHDDT